MNCSCEMPEAVKVFQLVLYIPTIIIGLILNALALQSFCWKLRKWTETTIYMTSLTISDLMVLLTLPFKIYSFQYELVYTMSCMLVIVLHKINICMSILIITCISVDRYIAIKYPFRAKALRSPLKAAGASAVFWIFSSLWNISFFYKAYSTSNVTNSGIICFSVPFGKYSIFKIVPSLIVFLVIPLIIVTFCSFQIIQTLHQRNRSNAEHFGTRRTLRIITANAVVFIVCFLPFNIITFIHVVMRYLEVDCSMLKLMCPISEMATCLADLNCCLDGFCFYLVTVEAKELFQNQPKDTDNNRTITLSTL